MADVSRRLEKADRFIQKGKLDSALDELLAALADDPQNDGVRQSAADLCATLNRDSDAARLLSELFDHQAHSGDHAKALVTYKKLARHGRPSVGQLIKFAEFSEHSNKREALEAYEQALQFLLKTKNSEHALEVLQKVVALEPSGENYRREGELAAEVGDMYGASRAFVNLGILRERHGEDPSDAYATAYRLFPENAGAALAHGRCTLAKGDAHSAIKLLEPLANYPSAPVEAREVLALALMAGGRLIDAQPLLWEMFERDPKYANELYKLMGLLLDAGEVSVAVQLARRLEEPQRRAGLGRDFLTHLKEIAAAHTPSVHLLEYQVEIFNSNNREADYCAALLQLFELYYRDGDFARAADCLDRAAEVDAYEPGHQTRLDMLRGKVDSHRFNALASRFTSVLKLDENKHEKPGEKETTVLEDLMLQAEIFLQYSMRSKAIEHLERIAKRFPGAEKNNEKLRQMFINAGMPVADASPAPIPQGKPATSTLRTLPPPVTNEAAVDNISRVTEITRNIYRQGNVKSVLFAAVNDIGRHWNASRCIAGLCTPGKPPSAAMEYCAPGIKESDVMAIVKLLTTMQMVCSVRGPVAVKNAASAPEVASIRAQIVALEIETLLAVPLMDGDEQVGILILQQVSPREWHPTDFMVLRTMAEQMVLACNNAKLRSLVKTLAVTEEKSGLLKRSSYIDVMLSEVKRTKQQESTVSVLLMEFGKASTMIRELGEATVESTMQSIAQTICGHIRQNDVAVRYDLTRIAVVLADTNESNSFFVVEKLRNALEDVRIPGRRGPLPMSTGIAEAVINPKYDAVDIVTEVINRAEAALDNARADGGNHARSLAPSFAAAVAS
jgi:diguanylate cyclase (GGDEF)-like protein